MPAIERTPVPDRQTQRFVDNVVAVMNPILMAALLGGRLLQGVDLAVGTNKVNHGLGRKLIGWFPVRVRASAILHDLQDSNTTPDKNLSLVTDAEVTVDLYVF